MQGSRVLTRMLILGIIFIGLGFAIYNGFVKDKTVVQAGKPAPDFVLHTLEGKEFQLGALKGKGVVLNFWGTWCPPCRDEMPELEKSYQAYKDKGIEIIALNIGEGDVVVSSFRDRYKLSFPIVMDRKKEITTLYEIGPIPTTYFIDKNGIVKEIVVGGPMSEETLTTNIKQILP